MFACLHCMYLLCIFVLLLCFLIGSLRCCLDSYVANCITVACCCSQHGLSDGSPTVRRDALCVVMRRKTRFRVLYESRNMRITRIADNFMSHESTYQKHTISTRNWPLLEVLRLGPLDGSIRIPYCLGSCQGQSACSPLSKKKCQHGNSMVTAWQPALANVEDAKMQVKEKQTTHSDSVLGEV